MEAVAGAGEIALLPLLDVHGQHFGLDSLTISCDDLHALPGARLKEDQMQCAAGGAELERERLREQIRTSRAIDKYNFLTCCSRRALRRMLAASSCCCPMLPLPNVSRCRLSTKMSVSRMVCTMRCTCSVRKRRRTKKPRVAAVNIVAASCRRCCCSTVASGIA